MHDLTDTLTGLLIAGLTAATVVPMAMADVRLLLQTVPRDMAQQLDRLVREVSLVCAGALDLGCMPCMSTAFVGRTC